MVFESKTKQILMIQKPKGVCLAWNYRNEKEKLTTNVFFVLFSLLLFELKNYLIEKTKKKKKT